MGLQEDLGSVVVVGPETTNNLHGETVPRLGVGGAVAKVGLWSSSASAGNSAAVEKFARLRAPLEPGS